MVDSKTKIKNRAFDITFDARAVLKDLRVTPQKSRRVINLVRNKGVDEARAILKFSPQAVSEPILKLLNSAVSNALTKADRLGLRVTESRLFISEIFADEGQTMKRFRPRARGSAGRIFKRTSHITLIVATDEEVITVSDKSSKKSSKKSDSIIKDADKNITTETDVLDKEGVHGDSIDDSTDDPAKALGKKHRAVGSKSITASKTNTTAKRVVAKQKKGA